MAQIAMLNGLVSNYQRIYGLGSLGRTPDERFYINVAPPKISWGDQTILRDAFDAPDSAKKFWMSVGSRLFELIKNEAPKTIQHFTGILYSKETPLYGKSGDDRLALKIAAFCILAWPKLAVLPTNSYPNNQQRMAESVWWSVDDIWRWSDNPADVQGLVNLIASPNNEAAATLGNEGIDAGGLSTLFVPYGLDDDDGAAEICRRAAILTLALVQQNVYGVTTIDLSQLRLKVPARDMPISEYAQDYRPIAEGQGTTTTDSSTDVPQFSDGATSDASTDTGDTGDTGTDTGDADTGGGDAGGGDAGSGTTTTDPNALTTESDNTMLYVGGAVVAGLLVYAFMQKKGKRGLNGLAGDACSVALSGLEMERRNRLSRGGRTPTARERRLMRQLRGC